MEDRALGDLRRSMLLELEKQNLKLLDRIQALRRDVEKIGKRVEIIEKDLKRPKR